MITSAFSAVCEAVHCRTDRKAPQGPGILRILSFRGLRGTTRARKLQPNFLQHITIPVGWPCVASARFNLQRGRAHRAGRRCYSERPKRRDGASCARGTTELLTTQIASRKSTSQGLSNGTSVVRMRFASARQHVHKVGSNRGFGATVAFPSRLGPLGQTTNSSVATCRVRAARWPCHPQANLCSCKCCLGR